jgi:hypothetical protein
MRAVVNIRDENYETTFIKEIYGDSNALTGKIFHDPNLVDHDG